MMFFEIEVLSKRQPLDNTEKGYLSVYPELQNFTSLEGVMSEILIRQPQKLFDEDYNMTLGDKVAAAVTILSALGIEYVYQKEMRERNNELLSDIEERSFHFIRTDEHSNMK